MSFNSISDMTFSVYRAPVSAIISWPPADYDDPETRRWYIPYAAVLQTLSTLTVAIRLWTRFGLHKGGFGADDYMIIVGWIFAVGHFSTSIWGVVDLGIDRHVWDVRPAVFDKALLLGWLSTMCFVMSMSAVKASVLLFFLRLIDRRHSRTLHHAVVAGIALIAMTCTAWMFVLIFSCKPISAVFRGIDPKWATEYRCINREPSDLFNGIFNICTDIISIILPVMVVRGLSMDRGRKIILYIIFCCSLVVIAASITRTIFGKRLYRDSRADLTWVGYDLFVWSSLEMHLALICASAPAVRGFISAMKQVMQSKGSRTDGSSNHIRTPMHPRRQGATLESRKLEVETESTELIVQIPSEPKALRSHPTRH